MKKLHYILLTLYVFLLTQLCHAVPGLLLAKDGNPIFNKSSYIIYARNGEHNSITFTGDIRTAADEVLILIPLPTNVKYSDIKTVNIETMNHLLRYSAPRLIEYEDFDPCNPKSQHRPIIQTDQSFTTLEMDQAIPATIDLQTKSNMQYDFVMLTSKESVGIDIWLKNYGYSLSQEERRIIHSYQDHNQHFLTIRVKNFAKEGDILTPIQISYNSKTFTLPTKITALNNESKQDTVMMFLTKNSEVILNDNKILDMPVNMAIPTNQKEHFTEFYNKASKKIFSSHPEVVRLEYSWPINACKPCTDQVISLSELSDLGVNWYHTPKNDLMGLAHPSAAIYLTRLHAQFDADTFATDFHFSLTAPKNNYQSYFNIFYPVKKEASLCPTDFSAKMQKLEEHYESDVRMLTE